MLKKLIFGIAASAAAMIALPGAAQADHRDGYSRYDRYDRYDRGRYHRGDRYYRSRYRRPRTRVVVRTYYVAPCNECGRDTTPTLKRLELDGNRLVETSLVEGVENLQLEYGFDRDNDGNADVFLPTVSGVAGAPENDWANVVAARVYVLGRTSDVEHGHVEADRVYDFGRAGSIAGEKDAHKRALLAALVRLPNVAGPRELP